MCGIAGYVDFASGSPDPLILKRMTRRLSRRGPDASGIVVDGPCGLAHTRLSIIDLSGSHQPMRCAGSDVLLTYNGELYNYHSLRTDLAGRGATLETSGDTEALLRWVELEWHEALPRFDGMFGFGAWHTRRQAILLGRDPMGVKPLFYAVPGEGVLVFGSEVKALLEHPLVDRELDEASLLQVLRFRAVYGDRSLHRGIRQLDPGCWLEFSRDGIRSGRYFDLIHEAAQERQRLAGMSDDQILADGRARLESAVRKRLVADVPVGAFLSGGLDSSLIAATMRRCRSPGEAVETFSVGFAEDRNSELPFARQVADALGTRHTEVKLLESDYRDLFVEMTVCRDAPISEPADLAIARMSDVARRSVKVVLSGEGADEGFAGYPKYRFAGFPAAGRAIVRAMGAARLAKLAGWVGLDPRRVAVAARSIAHGAEIDRLAQWFSYFDQAALGRLLPGLDWSAPAWSASTEPHRLILDQCGPATPMARMQTVDCRTWLPGNLLERGDRMTMAYGLELRVPFLDKRMVPFGLALDDRMKMRGGRSKWIVRQWARDLLPPQIVDRRKWGFKVPLAEWFRGRLRPMLQEYVLASDGLCGRFGDRSGIHSLIQAHVSGRTDAHMELWTLLAAEVWYRHSYKPAADRRDDAEPGPARRDDRHAAA